MILWLTLRGNTESIYDGMGTQCYAKIIVHNRNKTRAGIERAYKGKKKTYRPYAFSGVFEEDGITQYFVFKNAFQLLFNVGTVTIQSVEKSIEDSNLVPSLHGMCC